MIELNKVFVRFNNRDMPSKYESWEKLVAAVLKKEQYRQLALCPSISSCSSSSSFSSRFDHHLLDDHNPTFIPETSGKMCYMVGAKELGIIWCGGDNPRYWDFTSHPDSRFSEVAQLKSVCWLEIRGIINTRLLSSNTIYGAYLVFNLEKRSYGLESANAFVRFMKDKLAEGGERDVILGHFSRENGRERNRQTGEVPVRIGDGLTEIAKVHLQLQRRTQSRHHQQHQQQQQQQQTGRLPMRRGDGWMEMEMGSFYCDGGDDGAVEAWLLGTEGDSWKSGLIVQGIEFRPKP